MSAREAQTTVIVVAGVVLVAVILAAATLVLSRRPPTPVPPVAAGQSTTGTPDGSTSAPCLNLASAPVNDRYESTPGYHGIRIWEQDKNERQWNLKRIGEVGWDGPPELAACVVRVSSTPTAEICDDYEGGRSLRVHDATWEVKVVLITDGSIVRSTTLPSGPTPCPFSEAFEPGVTVSDTYRDAAGLEDFLRPLVEVKDATGAVPTTVPTASPLPTTNAPGCPQPPFSFALRTGDGVEKTIAFPYAWAISLTSRARLLVILTDFPVDVATLKGRLPKVPEGSTMVELGVSLSRPNRGDEVRKLQVARGDSYERSPASKAGNEVDLEINSESGSLGRRSGQVTVTSTDAQFVCLDVNLLSETGAQAVGKVAAAVVIGDDKIFAN